MTLAALEPWIMFTILIVSNCIQWLTMVVLTMVIRRHADRHLSELQIKPVTPDPHDKPETLKRLQELTGARDDG